jgi:hypothetical protein
LRCQKQHLVKGYTAFWDLVISAPSHLFWHQNIYHGTIIFFMVP